MKYIAFVALLFPTAADAIATDTKPKQSHHHKAQHHGHKEKKEHAKSHGAVASLHLSRTQRAQAQHMLAITKTLVLSAFPKNGKKQKLTGPEFDEMLETLNLYSLKDRLNTTLSQPEVIPFVEKTFGCVEKNEYMDGVLAKFWQKSLAKKSLWEKHVADPDLFWTEVSSTAPSSDPEEKDKKMRKSHFLDLHDEITSKVSYKFGLLSEKRRENIRHVVRLTFLLNAFNTAFSAEECHDPKGCGFHGHVDHNYIGFKVRDLMLANRKKFNWKKYAVSSFERMKAGFFFDTIEKSSNFIVNGRALDRNSLLTAHNSKYTLPLNIMMAGYHDRQQGNMQNYATSVYLASHANQVKEVQYCQAFVSWDLAFISQFKHNILMMSKLLEPNVGCAATEDPDTFMASRIISMDIFVNYLFAWRAKEGDSMPESFADWSSEDLTELWGKANKEMIVGGGTHVDRERHHKKREIQDEKQNIVEKENEENENENERQRAEAAEEKEDEKQARKVSRHKQTADRDFEDEAEDEEKKLILEAGEDLDFEQNYLE